MLGLFRRKPPRDPAVTARVKTGVAALLGLTEDDTIMLAELRCRDAGCPDLETVVTVACADRRRFELRFPKPLAEIGPDDFATLATRAERLRASSDGSPEAP